MKTQRKRPMAACILMVVSTATLVFADPYSGGTGKLNDPYQIATTQDLLDLGANPNDYDKHFILTADIDIDPNLPGGQVFDRAVIAPDTDREDIFITFQGPAFTGSFDGNDHMILNMSINGTDYLGFFGQIGSDARITNLRITASVYGIGDMGIIAGHVQGGTIFNCSSKGVVQGYSGGRFPKGIGGLVGWNTNGITVHTNFGCSVLSQ